MKFYLFLFTMTSFSALGQTDTIKEKETPKIKIEGYTEVYYCYDMNNPSNHVRPGFLYNHNKHNEININIAFLKTSYANNMVRGNVALMAGTYAQYNLSAEERLLQNIYEANAGFKLAKNLWLDAGVFSSHIGFESAVSKDCWTLTRSLCAENSPYYQSGAELNWTPKDNWLISVMYLNGWQRIQRIPGNNSPSFGLQVNYKHNDNISVNYSNYYGNTYPDSIRKMRYFNNLHGAFQLTKKFGIIAGFDYGMEQMQKDTSKYNQWYTPVVIMKYKFNDQFAIAARGEYFNDKNGVVISTGTPNGFDVIGYSLNFDYSPASNMLFRVEGRIFQSKDLIFTADKNITNQNVFFTTSMAISF